MKPEQIEWLDIQQDREVPGRWIIANNLDSESLQVIGIRYVPHMDPPQLYDRMANWLRKQTPAFIDQTVIGVVSNITFEQIEDFYWPDETYTAAELLFRPHRTVGTTLYVSDHFKEFQQFCQTNGLTEPPLTTTVYMRIMETIDKQSISGLYDPYNATEGYHDPNEEFQYYRDHTNLPAEAREREMAHPTPLPPLTEENKTQPIPLKNDMNGCASGMLIDYYFLKDWAERHGSTQPECWAMNMIGEKVTEIFIATHGREWKEFLTRQQVADLSPIRRSTHYKAYVSHFESAAPVCETPMELHQLLVQHPETIQLIAPNDPLLYQIETWCPIKDYTAEAWNTLKACIPETLWANATLQADALSHDPTVVTQIGDRLRPENFILLTSEHYPLLSDTMKTNPQLAPLALQCVLKEPSYIQEIPTAVVTPEMVRLAASQSLSAVVNLPVNQLKEARFTDAELTYMLGQQTLGARQAECLIRKLPQAYPTQQVEQALARLAEKHQLTNDPTREENQPNRIRRGR